MACPDKDCKENRDRFEKEMKAELFGTGLEGDGMKGEVTSFRTCLNKKAGWKTLGGTTLTLLGLLVLLFVGGLKVWSQDKKQLNTNTTDIKHIKEEISEIKTSVKEIKETQLSKDDVKSALVEAIEETRRPRPAAPAPTN